MKEVMNYRTTKISDNIYYKVPLADVASKHKGTVPMFLCTVCGRESSLFFSHCSHKPELSEVIDVESTKRRFRFLDLGKLFVTRKNQ